MSTCAFRLSAREDGGWRKGLSALRSLRSLSEKVYIMRGTDKLRMKCFSLIVLLAITPRVRYIIGSYQYRTPRSTSNAHTPLADSGQARLILLDSLN